MAGRANKRSKFDDGFEADANEALVFHLAKPSAEGLQNLAEPFGPGMCHQVFGDEETIVGYSGLTADVWLCPQSFRALLQMRYAEKQEPCDNVLESLQEWFNDGAGIDQDKPDFLQHISAQAPVDAGSLGSLLLTESLKDGATLEVYHTNLATASEAAKAVHKGMQPLLIFYIDAASLVDQTDEKWELLLGVLRQEGQEPAVVGMCTAYRFYCYPDCSRLRLSQLLTLPPYQRKGIAAAMVKGVYALAAKLDARDIPFENPTEEVQALRQKLDLELLRNNADITTAAEKAAEALASGTTGVAPPRPGSSSNSLEGGSSGPSGRRHPNPLALPGEVLQPVQVQTRLTTSQIRYTWEAVLYMLNPSLRSGKGLQALQQLVRTRIEGSGASAKRDALGKTFSEAEGGKSWLMARGPGRQGVTWTAVEAEEDANREAAVSTMVSERIAELRDLAKAHAAAAAQL